MRLAPKRSWLAFVVPLLASSLGLVASGLAPAAAGSAGGPWVAQAPFPSFAWLKGADMVSATEAWVIGGGGTLLHTLDGGVTWDARTLGSPNTDLNDVEFRDPQHGWVAGSTVWRTSDGGATWQSGTGLPGSVKGIGFRDLNTGFATFEGGLLDAIYRTDDAGATWRKVPTQLDVTTVQFFDGTNGVAAGPQGVLHSADGGDTWTSIRGSHGGFFIDPNRGWYAFEGTYVRTKDGGRTWQDMSMPPNVWVQTGAYFVDATHGWVAGDGQAVADTADGGRTWTWRMGGGFSYYDLYRFWAIDFADTQHGIAVGEGGAMFTTTDGGKTWVNRQSGTANEVLDIAAVDDQHAWASQAFGEVEYTEDGGATWVRTNPYHQYSLMYGVDFADTKTGWVVGEDYNDYDKGLIFSTTDGGHSWFQQWIGSGEDGLQAVEALDDRTAVAVGSRGVLRTTDGGQTWRQIGQPRPLLLAVTFVGNTGWAVGDTLVMRTQDRGAHWKLTTLQLPFDVVFNDIDFADDGLNGWIVGFYGYVMHTSDGGRTWTKQEVGVDQTTVSSVNVTGPGSAWISGGTGPFGGEPFVKYTNDGGRTWQDRTPPVDRFGVISAAAFVSDTVGWAGGITLDPGEGLWGYKGA